MDLLQVALVFLILLLAVFLSVLGIQVFYILKDLKRSLERFEEVIGSETAPSKHPATISAEMVDTFKKRALKILSRDRPSKRLFKRR